MQAAICHQENGVAFSLSFSIWCASSAAFTSPFSEALVAMVQVLVAMVRPNVEAKLRLHKSVFITSIVS